MLDRGKGIKTRSLVKPAKNKWKSAEFCKIRAKGSPSFTENARPCIQVVESFWIKARELVTEKLRESIKPTRSVSHTGRTSGEFDSMKDSQSIKFEEGLEYL